MGAIYYPPTDNRKWELARSTIPGAIVAPGDKVEFAYHVRLAPLTNIDHAEITYEDAAGREYVERDYLSVDVVPEGEECKQE
jgi:hypothetical protein